MPSDPHALGSVLVTGASGFVGSAIAAEFRQSGYAVRTLVRPSSSRINLDPRDETVVGDLLDRASVAAALKGVRYLVHAAADYRLWAPSPDELMRANVEGTQIVMQEALRAGVERIVYTSSVATFDLRSGGLADETRHLPATEAIGAYKRSKILAEDTVAGMVARERLPAVIVNPSTPIGPRDVKPTPTGRIIIEAASGRMPAYIDTGLNFVHVDDVAAGHLAALQRGRIGERYILGGENVTLRQMLIDIAGIVGRRARPLRLPRGLLYPFAFGAEIVARATGRAPFATVDGLRLARYTMHFDDGKARRELGYRSRPYREGLIAAIEWFIAAGYMKRPPTMRRPGGPPPV
jgi:dihydroflavonol-4-reductase